MCGFLGAMANQIDNEKVKEGHILEVWNTEKPRFSNANLKYFVIHCERGGKEFPIMLTENELNAAVHRAKQNPEDVPKKGFITDMLD